MRRCVLLRVDQAPLGASGLGGRDLVEREPARALTAPGALASAVPDENGAVRDGQSV